ncbi:unnamed protein product [Prorocentrum cordatum]|uniref:Uncharacterized protein n=1 Tax=Prorocentrum cordatum TaxID=2364126 RepID=A0ABN9TYJ4_9DINO|nr:unnamed protein product [Polarella glacialis]
MFSRAQNVCTPRRAGLYISSVLFPLATDPAPLGRSTLPRLAAPCRLGGDGPPRRRAASRQTLCGRRRSRGLSRVCRGAAASGASGTAASVSQHVSGRLGEETPAEMELGRGVPAKRPQNWVNSGRGGELILDVGCGDSCGQRTSPGYGTGNVAGVVLRLSDA